MATSMVRWAAFNGLTGVGLLALVVGCSGTSAETKRQLDSLNERLLILQNDRDRLVERVDALESQVSHDGRSPEGSDEQVSNGAGGRPALKVVRLEPAPPSAADQPPSPEAAPEPAAGQGVDEPKVVLYGEGGTSGVRPSTEGVPSR